MARASSADKRAPVLPVRVACALGLLVCGGSAWAQAGLNITEPVASRRPVWLLEPSILLRETLTSNVRLNESGMADAVTEVSPQLRLRRDVGRIQGSLDYALTGLLYARNPRDNTVRQALAASGRAELVERWAFVDAAARISRESATLLPTAAADSSLAEDGRTEVATLQVAPHVRGSFGAWADYEARLNWVATRSKDSPADSYTHGARLSLAAPGSARRRLGWSLTGSHQVSRFLSGSRTESDRVDAALLYGPSPDWRLTARVGRELNDVLGPQRSGHSIYGLGLRWTPSERTLVQADADKRYFGHSHSVRLQHRMARSVWTFTDTRDVSDDAGTGSAALRTYFDLLVDNPNMVSATPDRRQREGLVEEFLRNNGLNRSSPASGGFLTTSVSLQRRQNLAMILTGVRTTLVVSAFRFDVQALSSQQSVLAQQAAGTGARQHGASLSLARRLTPVSALALEATYSRNASTSAAASATSSKSLSASWNRQMPEQAMVNLGARHSVFDGPSGGYRESAILATLTKRF